MRRPVTSFNRSYYPIDMRTSKNRSGNPPYTCALVTELKKRHKLHVGEIMTEIYRKFDFWWFFKERTRYTKGHFWPLLEIDECGSELLCIKSSFQKSMTFFHSRSLETDNGWNVKVMSVFLNNANCCQKSLIKLQTVIQNLKNYHNIQNLSNYR